MDHSINIYKNVISSELCDELISFHQKHKETPVVQKQFMVMEKIQIVIDAVSDYPEYDAKIHNVMIGIVDQLRKDREYFLFGVHDSGYELREVYGPTMIHADNQIDDEDVRVLSVIIALTDDYDGEYLIFQNNHIKLN